MDSVLVERVQSITASTAKPNIPAAEMNSSVAISAADQLGAVHDDQQQQQFMVIEINPVHSEVEVQQNQTMIKQQQQTLEAAQQKCVDLKVYCDKHCKRISEIF